MEVLGNLVGHVCLIYVDDVKVIGWSVEELISVSTIGEGRDTTIPSPHQNNLFRG